MASYKDIIPTFNPYVQQRPVEAMMKVGMYKQQRYDQGIQKIQESIDNIAGLDVVRPEDKEYLQSKLNQLGSQLSNVAGGDFSNFQLVNSVNGMTNQITKDPIVLNAVSNTAKYRKDLETIGKLQQEGKWAPSNQYAFDKDTSSWFEGGLDASYSANTSPYIDVTKESQEIVKNLAKDYTDNPIAFGPNGEVLDVITQQKIEGITPEKIQTALKAGLTPQAWRQLSIDGQYKYSNISSNQFVNDLNNGYQKTFSIYSDRRSQIMNNIATVKSQEEKQKLMNQISVIDQQINALKNEYNSVSSGFSQGNTEDAKSQYYTMNWLENTANYMSSRSESIKLMESPYFSIDMKKRAHNLNVEKFNETKKQNEFMRGIESQKLLEAKRANMPFGSNMPLPEPAEDPYETIQIAINNVDKKAKVADQIKQGIIDTFGWDTTVKEITVTDKNGNVVIDKQTKKPKTIISSEADYEISKLIEEGPNSSNAQVYDMVKSFYDANQEYVKELNKVVVAKNEAEKQVPLNIDAAVPEEYANKTYFGFTPSEAALLFDQFEQRYQSEEYVPGSRTEGPALYTTTYDDEAAKRELTPEQFDLYIEFKKIPAYSQVKKEVSDINNAVGKEVRRVNQERDKIQSELIYQSTPMFQRTSVPILLDNKRIKAGVDNIIGNVITSIESGAGWPEFKGSASDLYEIRNNLKDAKLITKDKIINIQGKDTEANIHLTDEQWQIITSEYQSEVNVSPEVQKFNNDILPSMLITNPTLGRKSFWTTAIPDLNTEKSSFNTNLNNAYFKSFDFPSVKKFNVSGNFVTTINPREDFNNGYFYLNIQGLSGINKRTGKKENLTIQGQMYPFPMTKDQAAIFMQGGFTDAQVLDFASRNFPEYDIIIPKD